MTKIDLSLLSFLKGVSFFEILNINDLEWFAQNSTVKSYTKGDQILRIGENSTDLYCILSGHARVLNYTESGREVLFNYLYAGDIFGEISALDGLGRSAHVEAKSNMKVIRTERDIFIELLNRSPEFSMKILMHLAQIIRTDGVRIFEGSTKNSRFRLIQFLMRMAEKTDEDKRFLREYVTHKSIAGHVGSTRETITRLLRQLIEEGLIARERRRFVIPSFSRLQEVLDKAKE